MCYCLRGFLSEFWSRRCAITKSCFTRCLPDSNRAAHPSSSCCFCPVVAQQCNISIIGLPQTLSMFFLCSTTMTAASVLLYKVAVTVELLNASGCPSTKLVLSDVLLCEHPVYSRVHSVSDSCTSQQFSFMLLNPFVAIVFEQDSGECFITEDTYIIRLLGVISGSED